MSIRLTAAMLNLILDRLSRLLPQDSVGVAAHPWTNEDSSWHSSSFDLARGLDVIEHRGPPQAVFADTAPAFQRAKA